MFWCFFDTLYYEIEQYSMWKEKDRVKLRKNKCIKSLFSNCRIILSIADIIVDIEDEK